MKRFALLFVTAFLITRVAAQDVIDIFFNGNQAEVTIPTSINDVMSSIDGANVTLFSMSTSKEYSYRVSGETTDGSLTITGSYKLTLQLAGVNIVNSHGGPAIDIQCGKRIAVELVEGTTNTLIDSPMGDQKAAFYFKGHPEFKGGGTLNVMGKLKHAISAKEYIELKSSTGTINILGAVSDGIHCGKGEANPEHNYFEMKGGVINITNVGSDCLDADDYGSVRINGGILSLNVCENSSTGIKADSTLVINGGNINIAVTGTDSEGLLSRYYTYINDGNISILVTGDGSKGIKSKNDTNTTTVKNGGFLDITGGITEIYVTGSSFTKADGDISKSVGISVDADFTQTGGDVILTAMGQEAQSLTIDGGDIHTGGTLHITRAPWETNMYDFQYGMTMYVNLSIPETDFSQIAVGAFIDNECVGVAQFKQAGYGILRVRSNNTVDQQAVTFKMYNYLTGCETDLTCSQNVIFESEGIVGLPTVPVSLSPSTIAVTGITLSQTSASLVEGETMTLSATVTPDDATDKTVTWSTSDAAIVTVDNGVVTAVAAGTATITAKAGDRTATCVVTVAKKVIAVTGITLSQSTATLTEGESLTLSATVAPDDATDKTVTWSTSDASIVTVDNGVVTTVAAGTATITAKAGDRTATCVVTVAKKVIAVTGITLSQSTATLTEGESLTLSATVAPDDATDKTVTWGTSDAAVATVDNGVVTAVAAGTATITAKAGDRTATCVVTVAKKVIAVTGITLSQTSASLVEGETMTLSATVAPDDATDKTVTWGTSDATVVTVDNGVVTAVAAGTATITAKAGDRTATCVVIVEKKAAEIVYAEIANGDYYLKNVGSGKFLTGANDWGTQVSLGEYGLSITLERLPNGKYTLDTHVANNETDHYLGSNGYIDASATEWIITEPKSGTYALTLDGINYWGYDGSGTVLANALTDLAQENAQWQLVTRAELENALSKATLSNGVDATFYIQGHSFNRNHNENAAWMGEPVLGGPVHDMNAERFNTTSLDIYQELSGMPNGYYVIEVQGFYRDNVDPNVTAERHAAGGEQLRASLYAGVYSVPLKSILDGATAEQFNGGIQTSYGWVPNSMDETASYFAQGLYVNKVDAWVTDGTLRIGIRKETGEEGDWVIFDNFRLTYYGTKAPAGIEQLTIDNGQLTIYDLMGRRVTELQKGMLYLKDGKKFINR